MSPVCSVKYVPGLYLHFTQRFRAGLTSSRRFAAGVSPFYRNWQTRLAIAARLKRLLKKSNPQIPRGLKRLCRDLCRPYGTRCYFPVQPGTYFTFQTGDILYTVGPGFRVWDFVFHSSLVVVVRWECGNPRFWDFHISTV